MQKTKNSVMEFFCLISELRKGIDVRDLCGDDVHNAFLHDAIVEGSLACHSELHDSVLNGIEGVISSHADVLSWEDN